MPRCTARSMPVATRCGWGSPPCRAHREGLARHGPPRIAAPDNRGRGSAPGVHWPAVGRSGGLWPPVLAPAEEFEMSAHPIHDAAPARRAGRRPVTTRSEIEHIALELFSERGFDTHTVDDIANAAGIGRRTVFRYYRSKNDIPWGAFDEELDRMRGTFAALPADLPIMAGVRQAVLDFNEVHPEEQPWHRRRVRLILHTPPPQAHRS